MIKLSNFRTDHVRNWDFSNAYKSYATSLLLALVSQAGMATTPSTMFPLFSPTLEANDDKAASSIPQNIKELAGKEISFAKRNVYISENRPWQYDKMFLLYNVGTGKFLNVGSYWGTHAVLSDVPRPFWFQRRNDKRVTALYGYKRYPTTQDANVNFADQFAAIKNFQIGSHYTNIGDGTSRNQSSIESHVKYNYIKVIGKDEDAATAGTTLCPTEGYEPNGAQFLYTPSVDLNTQKIVAQIDLTNCQANYTSGGKGELENILSVGPDITKWDNNTYDIHIFASKTSNGHYEVRVQCLNENYKDATHKQIIDITNSQGDNHIINIEITKESILVAGVECMPKRFTASTENPIEELFEQNNIEVGSSYSSVRSNATYNYVKIVTGESQSTTSGNILKPGTSFPTDYSAPITFMKTEAGDLQTWGINADIDLSTCVGENENVLSIGTDITKQDGIATQGSNGIALLSDEASTGYNNLHFFYNATTHQLKLYYVNSAAETPVQTVDITSVDASHQRLKVYLDGSGLVVNDKTLDDVNDVVKNLTNSEKTSDIQVGSQAASTDNTMGSHAIYHELSMNHAYPQAGDAWNGKRFMKQITGNLTNWNLEWTLDLSTCVGSGSKKIETVLSIGEDIAKWGDAISGGNIHIYYTPSTKTIEFDAVNSENPSDQYRIKKTFTDEELKTVNIKLTQEGMYLNGILLSGAKNGDYSASNPVIYYLTHCDYLQIGSQEGEPSHATYVSESITSTGVKPADPDTPAKPLGDYPEDGDKWDGREFMKEYEGNLSNWAFDFTLDLSTCVGSGKNKNENILSIGEDIAQWGDANSGGNIHIYYTPGTKTIEFDAVNSKNASDQYRIKKTFTEEELKAVNIKLTQEGMYLNGALLSGAKYGDYSASNPIIYYLTHCDYLQIGSKEGSSRSHATYTTMTVNKVSEPEPKPDPDPTLPSFPTAGTQWDGKTAFSKTFEGNLSGKSIEAELDLSKYSTSETTSSVLSIGTDIGVWGNGSDGPTDAHANNIHFYYPKYGKLAIDIVSNDYTGFKYTSDDITIGDDHLLKISLTKDGLVVNGKAIIDANSAQVRKHVFDYLMNEATFFDVGAKQGNALSKAKYNKLDITDVTSEAKILNANNLSKSVATYSAEESSTDKTTYYPYKDYTADGKTSFKTEAYKMNFENGDYVEAEIDLSTSPARDANLFSIGTNIDIWGYDQQNTDNNADNIHFFYREKNGDNALVQVVFTNKNHNDDLKQDLVIKPNAEGKLVMHILLSKEKGLMVNEKKVYYSAADDPMPVIPYNAEYATEIVKFKYDANDEPALDENGKYIVVNPGDEGYQNAKPIRENTTDYMYTTDDRANDEMPVFITSQFNLESGVSGNEGSYLSWSPYLYNNNKWGTVGVFADRNLPQSDITSEMAQKTSEWFFKPVEGKTNTYQIYLKMDEMEVPRRDMSTSTGYRYDNQSGNFILQATTNHVYGNGMENYGGGTEDDKEASNQDGVEAICGNLSDNDENSQWKIFDVEEYYGLFKAANSEMSTKLNLTYSMRDPDFTRENADLNKWIVDEGLQGTNQVQVGFDQYTKKYNSTLATPGFEQNYTDYDGKRDITQNGTVIESGNEQFKYAKNHLNNHGRYMGVQVTNGGHGKFYQKDLQMIHSGWYVISCGGLSNVGAKLFVEFNDHTMKQDLHHVTQKELDYFNATDKVWPYDQCTVSSGTKAMPFYNALVAMNDDNADFSTDEELKNLKDKLTTQIAFYVSEADTKAGKTVTFGIEIPDASESGAKAASTAEGTTSDWTVFDNFHLLFGGDNAKDPNLMLDEDFTDLGYLDRSMHIFKERPMRLKRTFSAGEWNTLVLPVNLTKEQFIELLDNDTEAKLLKIKEIKGNRLIFTPETEETEGGVYFRANKPYLVKTSKEHGQAEAYTAQIYHWADGGKTYEDIHFDANHFVTFGVTLDPINSDLNSGTALYDFAGNDKYKTEIDGTKYDYVVNRNKEVEDEDVAYDMTDGVKNPNRYATFYGTLCKTFGPDANGNNAFIAGRPRLNDGKSFYMKPNGGNNFYYRKAGSGYGLKGFRCWFVYEDGTGISGAAAAKQFAIDINGVTDDVTDISNIERNDGAEIADQYANGIFNLNGQKVTEGMKLSDLPAGIYILNGKKYIVNK